MSSTLDMRDARWPCRHLVMMFLTWACAAMTPLADSTAQEVQPVFPARDSVQRPSKIDPLLADYMKRAGDSERITVVLLLERQLTADARSALLSRQIETACSLRSVLAPSMSNHTMPPTTAGFRRSHAWCSTPTPWNTGRQRRGS